MKNKIWIIVAIIISNFTTLTAHAMKEEGFEITFKGKRVTAVTLIEEARSKPQTHPFSATQLFQFYESGCSTFGVRLIGNICDISEENLNTIKRGNCAYEEKYLYKKTHFSQEMDVYVPAFILGTKHRRSFIYLILDRPPLAMPKQLK